MQDIIFILSRCKDWGDLMNSRTLVNINKNLKDLTFVLANRNYDKLGVLNNVDLNTFVYSRSTGGHEISFDIYKTLNGINEILWDTVTDLKLLWVKELDVYFEIYVTTEDSSSIKKTVTGTSLCEAELSQVKLYNIEINTEDDISRDNYEITTFYNMDNPNASLLNRILSKAANYKIKHVDASLSKIQRCFSVDNESIYDFLVGDCAEQFHCIFCFDSRDRSISVYDLYAVCQNNDCGYSSDIADFTHAGETGNITYTCPKCHGTDIRHYGEDTGIFIDKENLTDSVHFTTDTDSVKNCFKLIAGDDIITSTARLLNMNGTDYIYCITDEQKEDMPVELVKKINQYDLLYDSYREEYQKLIDDIYESSSKIYYYRHTMMPSKEHVTVNSSTEASKLTEHNLSPLGLANCSSSTSRSAVESALKNYAKVYVKTGYVKIEINESSYTYKGTDSDGSHFGYWTGNFKVTNYSDKDDVVYSDIITVKVHDNYENFISQKIKKTIAADDEDGSVFDVLGINNLDIFKNSLTRYGLNRLKSFYDAIQSALDCLVQLNQAAQDSKMYSSLYLPFYNKLLACQNEINKRQTVIDEWENKYNSAVLKQQEIQNQLNFKDYIGEELYRLFCSYRREDVYQNENYISDGLEDQQIIERAEEFLETAQKELVKSATRQHSISSTLHDLLLIPEFEPLLDKFEIGNWLRVRADSCIYKLRLIKYEISFSDINTISVDFSDVTKIRDSVTDTESILNAAQSMASSYSYISKQAEKGNNADCSIDDWVEHGLNSALVHIKNNDREEISYGKHGLLAREYDDISGDYSDEQLRFTHNILAFTEDNWKTVSLGLGKHEYTYYNGNGFTTSTGYGISAKFCQAAYIYGSQIIGGDIYSQNYSPTTGTHINLNDGTFSFAGGGLTYNGTTLSGKNLSVSASTITGTYISGGTISGNTISGNTISGGTISGTDIYSSNLYSGYISGGTITGTYIKGSTFETISNEEGSPTLKIKDAIISASYDDGTSSYCITPNSINLGNNAIVVSGFTRKLIDVYKLLHAGAITQAQAIVMLEAQKLLSKKVKIMGENFVVKEDEIDLGTSVYANEDIYIKKKLYINGIKFDEYEKQIDKNSTDIAGLKDAISSLRSTVSSIKSCNCS